MHCLDWLQLDGLCHPFCSSNHYRHRHHDYECLSYHDHRSKALSCLGLPLAFYRQVLPQEKRCLVLPLVLDDLLVQALLQQEPVLAQELQREPVQLALALSSAHCEAYAIQRAYPHVDDLDDSLVKRPAKDEPQQALPKRA